MGNGLIIRSRIGAFDYDFQKFEEAYRHFTQ